MLFSLKPKFVVLSVFEVFPAVEDLGEVFGMWSQSDLQIVHPGNLEYKSFM